MCRDNEKLKVLLNERNAELIEVYTNGSNNRIHADFGQMILTQVNEKQKLLVEENSSIDREFQRCKSELDRENRNVKELRTIVDS